MENVTSFEMMHDLLLSYLKAHNKVLEFSSYFGPNKLICDMFKYLWKSNEVHKYMKIHIADSSKNNEKAEHFRKEGNNYYKKKDFHKALEHYNMSIIYSPQQIVKEMNSENNEIDYRITRNLAVSYANRSAVLFELENYDYCLKDITRAFTYGYPSLLKSKLIERQAKCYLALNKRNNAKEILNKYFEEVESLDDKEKSALDAPLKKLTIILSNCNLEVAKIPSCDDSYSFEVQEKKYRVDLLDIPKLQEVNSAIPSLSSSVTLIYSTEKGRYLKSNRDINPGELLMVEKSFAAAVLPSALLTHCSFCLTRTYTPVPCSGCSYVVFCSDFCADSAKHQYHKLECSLLPTLVALDIGKNSILAFRLIIQMTLDGLKSKIPIYDQEKIEKGHLEIGFNNSNIYDSKDFSTIYNLVTNLENRTVSDLFKRGVMTVCLVKLLMKSHYFGSTVNTATDFISDDICLIGKTLFTLLMNLPCNAHSITEMGINSVKCNESCMEEIGAGAFGVLSLTNHSCNPTIARSSYGSTIVARAIQFIPKGTEITDSYGYHFAIHNIEERQNELKKQYYFTCSCEACVGKWIKYPSLHNKVYLKCPKCFSKMVSPVDECSVCKTNVCAVFPDSKSSKEIYSDLQSAIHNIQELFNKNYDYQLLEKNEKLLTSTIYLICVYASLPSKALFEAQEMLKFYYDMKGSHYYI